MELTGKITLDANTMEELEQSIRSKIIDEIRESGNYSSEIISYPLDCKYKIYYNVIYETINHMLDNVDENDITWSSDREKLKKLKIIQQVMNL